MQGNISGPPEIRPALIYPHKPVCGGGQQGVLKHNLGSLPTYLDIKQLPCRLKKAPLARLILVDLNGALLNMRPFKWQILRSL